jgi:RimJ/RimL family protein N-acetyltransferase
LSERDPDFRRLHTERLLLRVPTAADADDLFRLYADPNVWQADPIQRQTEMGQTLQMIERWRDRWRHGGLGIWVAEKPGVEGNSFVGIGGCSIDQGIAWALGYRIRYELWRQGYAQEVARAAIAAARALRPELPITAQVLEGNERSQRTADHLGLRLVWRGADPVSLDPAAVALLFADRDLSPDTLRRLVGG